ncbi:hypothetical protein ABLE91_28580 [Aquabacter sp. CN5-332]|uniref:hypothetical protein n=1 Tax=Aquabacter sp. CN5-332 TaxID=3156608 RepID=UPI0032B4D64E
MSARLAALVMATGFSQVGVAAVRQAVLEQAAAVAVAADLPPFSAAEAAAVWAAAAAAAPAVGLLGIDPLVRMALAQTAEQVAIRFPVLMAQAAAVAVVVEPLEH